MTITFFEVKYYNAKFVRTQFIGHGGEAKAPFLSSHVMIKAHTWSIR